MITRLMIKISLNQTPAMRAVRIVGRAVDADAWRHGVWTHTRAGRFRL
ncbi:hypothetical protein PBI_HOWE_33 [Gordonia phage Howe]|uniref:Uncharacterized protein n=1 Tax=Gordonia phage Howe TaxID=1777061 RepID=A0A0U4K417_9CAUD|nr:hypothetical protein PP513_gp33 [Gordonia phage Howe]ALY07667.1 hypothetical protein PBI_HOWE_33 [Gordonia phage Howe]UAJ16331.1 hypothetical protein SEA_HORTENSE_33 [Gordonia phage Hortense]